MFEINLKWKYFFIHEYKCENVTLLGERSLFRASYLKK